MWLISGILPNVNVKALNAHLRVKLRSLKISTALILSWASRQMWLTPIVLSLSASVLLGCATKPQAVKTDPYCKYATFITYTPVEQKMLTDLTLSMIVEHNLTVQRLCHGG